MRNVLHVGIVFIVGFLGLGSSCETDLLDNDGFNIWCGDRLCAWEVEEGEVRKVKTWHPRDYGASLEGSRVTISQLSDVADYESTCFKFYLQADMDDGVEVQIALDFDDDGTIEYQHTIVSDDWESVDYKIATPTEYDGVRFYVKKFGDGRAILARIRPVTSGGCAGESF